MTLYFYTGLSGYPLTSAPLVPGAVPLEEQGRYESSRNFDDTVQYYYRKFRGTGLARWKNIVNLPTVRAKHLQSKHTRGLDAGGHRGAVGAHLEERHSCARSWRQSSSQVLHPLAVSIPQLSEHACCEISAVRRSFVTGQSQ